MKFFEWLNSRTGVCSALAKFANMQSPIGGLCCRFLPVALVFLFMLQLITGAFLWAFYSSSTTSAWESVFYIQYVLPYGWFVRGVHHYSAQLFVGVSGIYVLALILHGAYRRPREFVYWSVLTLFLLSLCSCLTGDLLPWSQSGYFATMTRVSFLQLLPIVGVPLYQIVVGGPDPQFGALTITRFLFLHIAVFGGSGFIVLCLWKYFDLRSRKLLKEQEKFDGIHKCCLACASKKTRPFWGRDALYAGVVCVIVFGAVLVLVFQHSLTSGQIADRSDTLPAESYLGAQLTSPVDVANSYDAARPEWSFRALYQMTKLPIFSKIGMVYAIFVVPPLLLLWFYIVPVLGRRKPLHYLVVVATIVFFVVACYFTYLSYWSDYSPNSDHSASFLADVADAERSADRSIELAFSPSGIPKSGALTLMKNDPYLVGSELFKQHCASCHNFKAVGSVDNNPDYVEIACDDPTAPNLYGAGSYDWIRRFTSEKSISDPDCFGKTAFAEKGSMIGFLKGRVAGGMTVEGGAFILNGNGLIAKVIAPDGSPAFDILESVFEDFCDDDDNLSILGNILNESSELEDAAVEEAQNQYIAKLAELIDAKFADEEFVSELDPQLPTTVLTTLKTVLLDMLRDDVYREILFDEDSIELVRDEDYDEFLTDAYLATLNGNDEPILPDDLKYIDAIRESIVAACDSVSKILSEEAVLEEPRPFVDGQYYGLASNAISDMEFLTCLECHAFYGTENDHACDLRGYMSRNWIFDFIADPTTAEYYGSKNDRMPSYCPSNGGALMTAEEVGLLADWLSGEWYRAPKVDNSSRTGRAFAAKIASTDQEIKQKEEQLLQKAESDALKEKAQLQEEERKAAIVAELKAKEEKAKEAAEAKEKKAVEEKAKLENEIKELKATLDATQARAEDESQKANKASVKILDVEKERNAAQKETKSLQEQLTNAKSETLEARKQTDQAKADAEQLVAEVRAEFQRDLKEQETDAKNQLNSLTNQYQQAMNVQREALTNQVASAQDQLQKEIQARQNAENRAKDLDDALIDARKEIAALRERLQNESPDPAENKE